MAIDSSLQQRLADDSKAREAKRLDQQRPAAVGGGGEPPQDNAMEQRVRVLEASIASIEKTLAVMSERLNHLASKDDLYLLRAELTERTSKLETDAIALGGNLRTDLATLSGKIDRMALATDLAELKGRVARILTVPVLTSILVFVSLLFAAATWVLRHLPPAWANALQ